jgi:hypothetical protein
VAMALHVPSCPEVVLMPHRWASLTPKRARQSKQPSERRVLSQATAYPDSNGALEMRWKGLGAKSEVEEPLAMLVVAVELHLY